MQLLYRMLRKIRRQVVVIALSSFQRFFL